MFRARWIVRIRWCVTAVILAGGLLGCQTETQQEILANPKPPVADVPLPMEFVMVEERSRSYTVPDTHQRFVDYLFLGKADKFRVADFYETQMPVSRWKLQQKQFAQGRATQDYKKDEEKCRLTIWDEGHNKTYVHINITPAR